MTTEHPHTLLDDPGTNLASSRTAMALERTQLASDRTLMAFMRTALSLISFGFTIYQFLSKFDPTHPRAGQAARNFGLSLILLGIATLIFGLLNQFLTLRRMRNRANGLFAAGLLRQERHFRPASISLIAGLLALIGLVAIAGIWLHTGPFG